MDCQIGTVCTVPGGGEHEEFIYGGGDVHKALREQPEALECVGVCV